MKYTVSSMNRLSALILLGFCALALHAQSSSSITISTNPTGAQFSVDGTLYSQAVTFIWPSGSAHYVAFITDTPPPNSPPGTTTNVQTSLDGTTQWTFNGWQDNNGLIQPSTIPVQTIVANPAITTLTAQLTVAYRVQLSYYESTTISNIYATCATSGSAIPAGQTTIGIVYLGSTCFWESPPANYYFAAAGSSVVLNAYPYPGFAFTGWNINGGGPSSFLGTVTIKGPTTIVPLFVPAKRVSFLTSPLGLNVLVDHATVHTRTVADVPNCPNNETVPSPLQLGFPSMCFGDFDFAPGSSHFMSGVTPQQDASGNWWVFSSWSNGQGQNAILQVDNSPNNPLTLTANYVQGAQVALVTSPSGLKLTVDGDANYASYDFIWGVGTTHQVVAPASQKGSDGRMYTFQKWSNQTAPSQSITVDQNMAASGYRLTANYNELSRVVVQSSPSGLPLLVDGIKCVTPCNVDRQNGDSFRVTAPTEIALGQGSRLDFGSWSDSGASEHIVTVSQDYTTLTASYNTLYQLSASSSPANGSSFKFSPSSSDGFYVAGTNVAVTAVANPGFKFGHWSGDLSGSYPAGTVTMSAPVGVIAEMATVPYIAPAGISNAAGATPSSAVAPGSIISIFGQNLASVTQVGAVNPLAQSIGGTSVTVNNAILPLLFVSPQQINAQLPSNLPDGNYTLEVQPAGQGPISGSFTVARDAPGLFAVTSGSTSNAMAFHSDGSAITQMSPATSGETVSILGTGFGPYQTTILDGFFPPNPPPAVADPVVLSVAGTTVASTSTAAPGYTGIVATQFQVPTGLTSGTSVPVTVTINGVQSNTVMLPIQ